MNASLRKSIPSCALLFACLSCLSILGCGVPADCLKDCADTADGRRLACLGIQDLEEREACTNLANAEELNCIDGCIENQGLFDSGAGPGALSPVDVQGPDGRINPNLVPLGSQVELIAGGSVDISQGIPAFPGVCDEVGWADFRANYLLPVPDDVEQVSFEYLPWSIFKTLSTEETVTPGGLWIAIGTDTTKADGFSTPLSVVSSEFGAESSFILRTLLTSPAVATDEDGIAPVEVNVGFGRLIVIPFSIVDFCGP